MKPYVASFINAVVLIAFGAWGYFASANPSVTALIPVGTGLIILILNFGMRNGNRIVSHIVVVLTLLILVALFKPLLGAVDRSDEVAIFRVAVMILASFYPMLLFIKSFLDARKKD